MTNQGRDECTRRRPDDDFGLVGIPFGGHTERHEGGYLIGSPGYAPTTEDQSYPAHVLHNRTEIAINTLETDPELAMRQVEP